MAAIWERRALEVQRRRPSGLADFTRPAVPLRCAVSALLVVAAAVAPLAVALGSAQRPAWAAPTRTAASARLIARTAAAHALQAPVAGAFCGQGRAVGRGSTAILRHGKVDGRFGVLEESPSPIIDTRTDTGELDPLLTALVEAVQIADQKRGLDMSAFWINDRWEVVLIITALSRPQLEAIAQSIDRTFRKELRLKRTIPGWKHSQTIRNEAAGGWACMHYPRFRINIMTPVQRTYYDLEAAWRDENQDYEKIPLDVMLRADGFGSTRLTKELGSSASEEEDDDEFEDDEADEGLDYNADEEDPFWS
mmetsp:Transcript_59451/g.181441  ORF Transcript_59451/g.181441 Transcript_59451/m.181441 type:complete len:308 (-) Transcript_59451:115-1038(-)